jgi:hypothetical protein
MSTNIQVENFIQVLTFSTLQIIPKTSFLSLIFQCNFELKIKISLIEVLVNLIELTKNILNSLHLLHPNMKLGYLEWVLVGFKFKKRPTKRWFEHFSCAGKKSRNKFHHPLQLQNFVKFKTFKN